MIVRQGLPLRWRITVVTSLTITLLSVIGSLSAYYVVRSSLINNLQQALRIDAERVVQIYTGQVEDTGDRSDQFTPLQGPTGGVIIQLYNPEGLLVVASLEDFSVAEASLPLNTILSVTNHAKDWNGKLLDTPFQGVLSPLPFGVLLVMAPTEYISASLTQLARALGLITLLLILLGALGGYIVAVAAMRPVSQLAKEAAQLGPSNLQEIAYEGPEDEIGQLSLVLNNLVARLKAALDAQRVFLAETSHELRTPLTSLQGFLNRAVRHASPELRRDLDDAQRIANTMSRLVTDILQLSRGELVQEYVPHLLDPFEDLLEPIAEEFPGVQLDGEAGHIMLGDPERLRQLLRNLTANAVRASLDNSDVCLSLSSSNEKIRLLVADKGQGIPADRLPHIFEKFYKGSSGGAGLGLAIVKQIVDVHQGSIDVKSTEGQGTCFTVTLPALSVETVES